MNFKTTYILFGVLAGLVAVLFLALYMGPTPPSGAKKVFPRMHAKAKPVTAGDIEKIVIESKKPIESDLAFERVDDRTWKITSPRPLAAESGRVDSMVSSLVSA